MSLLTILLSQNTSSKIPLFILTGQSNSTGAALNADATTLELSEKPNHHIFRESDSFANLNISACNNYSQGCLYHGLELGLSVYLPQYYLIKWGVGSTSIDLHLSGGGVYTRLNNNFLTPGLAELQANNINYDPYVLWWQGEEDALNQTSADAYAAKFDQWVTLWKSRMGNDIKFRIMEICDTCRPYASTINGVFAAKAATEPNMLVMNNGSLSNNDHFQYNSMKATAQLIVDAMV